MQLQQRQNVSAVAGGTYQRAESRKLSVCSRSRRRRRTRNHSRSASSTIAETSVSHGSRARPIVTGAASQSKAPSKTATTRVAMGVRRMVRKFTSPFSTYEATNGPGKLSSWHERNAITIGGAQQAAQQLGMKEKHGRPSAAEARSYASFIPVRQREAKARAHHPDISQGERP